MPSSMITANEPGQIYWVDCLIYRSVGGSGGIFRKPSTSASTIPDSLGAHYLPYSSPSLPFPKFNTLQEVNQSGWLLPGQDNYLASFTLTNTLSGNIRVLSQS